MSDQPGPDELLAAAVASARAAGDYALANLNRRGETVTSTRHDVKLRLDTECQIRAEAVILERFPDHGILGEETAGNPRAPAEGCDLQWIVDPLDGTVNFSHGLPIWCSSVAVRRNDSILAGAVYAPELGELYTATADGPALVNGVEIRVSSVSVLSKAMVYTGTNKGSDEEDRPPFALFEAIARSVQRPRIVGSAALDLCRVARGQGDAYFEANIHTWDVAAAGLMVTRAGGKTEILRRFDDQRLLFMGTNGKLHESLKRLTLDVLETGG